VIPMLQIASLVGAICAAWGLNIPANSREQRFRLFLAALLATSLIGDDYVISQSKTAGRESTVIAFAAPEFVHDRIRTELPRIITWRPLPVITPGRHRRARPRAVPASTPKSG
jgi:hypothetical protein